MKLRFLPLLLLGVSVVPAQSEPGYGSRKLSTNPTAKYAQRVAIIASELKIMAVDISNDVDEAEKSRGPVRTMWIFNIKRIRDQIERLRSISPVPFSMVKADQNLEKYAVHMNVCLDEQKAYYYDRRSFHQIVIQEELKKAQEYLALAADSIESVIAPHEASTHAERRHKKKYVKG